MARYQTGAQKRAAQKKQQQQASQIDAQPQIIYQQEHKKIRVSLVKDPDATPLKFEVSSLSGWVALFGCCGFPFTIANGEKKFKATLARHAIVPGLRKLSEPCWEDALTWRTWLTELQNSRLKVRERIRKASFFIDRLTPTATHVILT